LPQFIPVGHSAGEDVGTGPGGGGGGLKWSMIRTSCLTDRITIALVVRPRYEEGDGGLVKGRGSLRCKLNLKGSDVSRSRKWGSFLSVFHHGQGTSSQRMNDWEGGSDLLGVLLEERRRNEKGRDDALRRRGCRWAVTEVGNYKMDGNKGRKKDDTPGN